MTKRITGKREVRVLETAARRSDARLPLHHRLRDSIAERIADRTWRPGEPIPSEQALAASFGVAPGTARRAVDTLVQEGWLERRQGKGTFVRRADFTSSLFRFFRHKGADGKPVTPTGRILMRESGPLPDAANTQLGLPPSAVGLQLRRLRLIAGQPLLVEEIWLPLPAFAALERLPPDRFGDLLYPLYEDVCGRVVARAEEELTVATADRETADRLGIRQGAPVIVIDRLAFDHADTPLEWRRSKGAADQFRYRVDIR